MEVEDFARQIFLMAQEMRYDNFVEDPDGENHEIREKNFTLHQYADDEGEYTYSLSISADRSRFSLGFSLGFSLDGFHDALQAIYGGAVEEWLREKESGA